VSARLHTACLPPPPPTTTTARPRLLKTIPITHTNTRTTTNHNSNTSSRNRIPQSTFKTLTCCIAARQPSIRSKLQRMIRDLQKMRNIGETCCPCTRASECSPTHSLSLPTPPQHAPASSKQYHLHTRTHAQPPITTATQAPANASLNQRSKHSLVALQHVSLQFSFIYWSRGVSHND
jgi:hypothetical protein